MLKNLFEALVRLFSKKTDDVKPKEPVANEVVETTPVVFVPKPEIVPMTKPTSPAWNDYVSMIDAPLLQMVAPHLKTPAAEALVEPLKAMCRKLDITNIRRVASFISQMAVESGLIFDREENLNYSAQGLANTWPNRYAVNSKSAVKVPNALALRLHRKPEAIANNVYANRMGNGDEASGDGWKYRGFTLKQITGCNNWTAFGKYCGMTADEALAYGRTIEGSLAAAGWFWSTNGLNPLADSPGVEDETHRINGGYNGLEARRTGFNKLVAELIKRERAIRNS